MILGDEVTDGVKDGEIVKVEVAVCVGVDVTVREGLVLCLGAKGTEVFVGGLVATSFAGLSSLVSTILIDGLQAEML